jgi:N-acylneuraminate cytidylyltransferase
MSKTQEQTNMKKLAIITARGGSKRIPYKNIKEFCGKPILSYSIEAALNSKIFDTVMVSTDDEQIANIAREYGAKVPFYRSEKTSNDYATTNDVLLEVLEEYENRGEHYDLACCIYPTAPFITSEKLKTAVETLTKSDADTLIPVVAFSYPPQRALVIQEGKLIFKYPEYLDSRSQDLEKHYHDVGQFYVFKTEPFKINKKLMQGNIIPMELPELEVQDIDNLTDWEIAEIKYKLMNSK